MKRCGGSNGRINFRFKLIRGIGGERDGPVGGTEWTAHARRYTMVSVDVVEPDVEPEGDGGQVFCEHDQIAHAHGAVVEMAVEGTVKAGGEAVHQRL
jgi:hypothetical protein